MKKETKLPYVRRVRRSTQLCFKASARFFFTVVFFLFNSLKILPYTAGVRAPPSFLGVFRALYVGMYGITKVKMKVLAHCHEKCAKVSKKSSPGVIITPNMRRYMTRCR